MGRFHDQETARSTTYLATTERTAWKEVTFRWGANRAAYRVAEVLVKLEKLIDLTQASTQHRYGVNEAILKGDDYGPCQQLAKRLRAEGVEGILTFSRADQPDGRQVVVFLDLLGDQSRVLVERIRPVAQSSRET